MSGAKALMKCIVAGGQGKVTVRVKNFKRKAVTTNFTSVNHK